ncbi:hypothetical protein PMKS-002206 [Pichia membranifaciens]|uniref:Uncharacterized protein n=1 Tax=Pichia membranifaciens TaxID=4926 RepID=A0A1Q2YGX3_9ASCO|nr:hypothetical protein PMKS-002206 [Pichia membranifaciens]
MYGIMPLEEYVANYDSILENKPFKYGNMKGKRLNKSKFFNDYSDYEILLRNEVPPKYYKYFDDHSSDAMIDDIEIGRSNKLNLSPVKNHQENGVKDSELLSKKESKLESDSTTLFRNLKKSMVNDENSFSLDLGNLDIPNSNNRKRNLSAKLLKTNPTGNRKLNTFETSEIDELEDFDALYEMTFKLLNKNSVVDKEGKQLNLMIQSLLETLKTVKDENIQFKANSENMKLIIKDLNSLINSYKSKLRDYYEENKSLKTMIKNERKMTRNIKSSDTSRNNIEVESEDLKSIDEQIYLLQVKRQRLMEGEKLNRESKEINLGNLSEDIVRKLMKQLQEHNGHMDDSKNATPTNFNENHDNCPFCKKQSKTSDNLLTKLLSSSQMTSLDQDEIIDLLASRIKFKLDTSNDGKKLPDIW